MTLIPQVDTSTALLLRLPDFPTLPAMLTLGGCVFDVKSEFHVTMLGGKQIRELGGSHALEAVGSCARDADFSVRLGDAAWRVTKNRRESIILLCEVDGAEGFFRNLEAALSRPIERPPYHVTLYTRGDPGGIGVYTAEDLEKYACALDEQERAELATTLETLRGQ